MSEEIEKKVLGERSSWAGVATIAGAAAIGSAALAAALIFNSRRKPKPTDAPAHPENAPETD
ncbi:hypothetical protein [Novosphingobium sp. KACC 22771]|uniref:hypothetical protein n=1 Tax=Novosphingobium sp. KACC 22771 TaxID=3025670 RepID=UPI0023660B2E|nr:hypothetical protein [Novosphingobium sp. KACC 22771]WDF71008.1 hypothetical protein PQ467_09150 [Novosphingobium sp. KACC 22771]